MRIALAELTLGRPMATLRGGAEHPDLAEALRRWEEGYRITNLDQFERKKVHGKTLITRKGSNDRISGMEVKLSSDPAS